MSALTISVVSLAAALACVRLGGALYEYSVVDPVWPRRLELIQPDRGGISRRRFWIPAHIAFELALIASLVVAWSRPEVHTWLLIGFTSHVVMRMWSAFDFIPKALAFERADVSVISEDAARRWTRRSLWRLPLDLTTCGTMFVVFAAATRLA